MLVALLVALLLLVCAGQAIDTARQRRALPLLSALSTRGLTQGLAKDAKLASWLVNWRAKRAYPTPLAELLLMVTQFTSAITTA